MKKGAIQPHGGLHISHLAYTCPPEEAMCAPSRFLSHFATGPYRHKIGIQYSAPGWTRYHALLFYFQYAGP